FCFFFFSSRRRHTRFSRDWSSDVCSSDLGGAQPFNQNVYTFFEVGQYSAHVGFMIDKLTAMMMVVVTFVSFLVHVYTIGYMQDRSEERRVGKESWTRRPPGRSHINVVRVD